MPLIGYLTICLILPLVAAKASGKAQLWLLLGFAAATEHTFHFIL